MAAKLLDSHNSTMHDRMSKSIKIMIIILRGMHYAVFVYVANIVNNICNE